MDEVLKPISHLGIGSYVDDIYVCTSCFDSHVYAILKFFERLRLYELTISI